MRACVLAVILAFGGCHARTTVRVDGPQGPEIARGWSNIFLCTRRTDPSRRARLADAFLGRWRHVALGRRGATQAEPGARAGQADAEAVLLRLVVVVLAAALTPQGPEGHAQPRARSRRRR